MFRYKTDSRDRKEYFLTTEELIDIRDQKTYIAVSSSGTYDDAFGIKHWFHVCAVNTPAFTGNDPIILDFTKCAQYGDADNNQ